MKSIRFTDLVETNFGWIRILTITEKWWLTILTFGLFRKIVSTLSGPAFYREKQLKKAWEKQFSFPPCPHWIEKTRTAYTFVFFFNFWREHMINYARTAGKILNERDRVMQLCYSMQEAWSRGNIELVHKIARKIRGNEPQQRWRKQRRCVGAKHRKNRPCYRKEPL